MLLQLPNVEGRLGQWGAEDRVFSSPRTAVLVLLAAPFQLIWFLILKPKMVGDFTASQVRVRESTLIPGLKTRT